jgi:hypothetical protein
MSVLSGGARWGRPIERRALSRCRRARKQWWAGTGLNRRHQDFGHSVARTGPSGCIHEKIEHRRLLNTNHERIAYLDLDSPAYATGSGSRLRALMRSNIAIRGVSRGRLPRPRRARRLTEKEFFLLRRGAIFPRMAAAMLLRDGSRGAGAVLRKWKVRLNTTNCPEEIDESVEAWTRQWDWVAGFVPDVGQ